MILSGSSIGNLVQAASPAVSTTAGTKTTAASSEEAGPSKVNTKNSLGITALVLMKS